MYGRKLDIFINPYIQKGRYTQLLMRKSFRHLQWLQVCIAKSILEHIVLKKVRLDDPENSSLLNNVPVLLG